MSEVTQALNVHEEFNRVILRQRWSLWALRQYRANHYDSLSAHMKILSNRLGQWKPTWESRRIKPVREMQWSDSN